MPNKLRTIYPADVRSQVVYLSSLVLYHLSVWCVLNPLHFGIMMRRLVTLDLRKQVRYSVQLSPTVSTYNYGSIKFGVVQT